MMTIIRGVPAAVRPRQASFDELGTPLREVTFVVVDLETTGGSPASAEITEVGAVKVRGGVVVGEFQSLVRPEGSIPAFIAVLTGITDAMVATAPPLDAVLPAFLGFCGSDAVLVAHNAPFDVGFLTTACHASGRRWPRFAVVDTARLARHVLTRDEAPNCKLATLARVLGSTTVPNHRALSDARATVDVLHALLERLGSLGVHSAEELVTFSSRVAPEQRRKRHLAEGLPSAPGVYVFRDRQGRPLYVGRSRDLRARVRSYFTASETRTRIGEMVGLAESVTPIECATPLEAEVRALRMIAEAKPRYNRRSRFPERVLWVKLTDEPFPRLSLVRELRADGGTYLGPFSSRRAAEQAIHALHEAVPLRQCTQRLSRRPRGTACILAGMGRCGAPCEGRQSLEEYAAIAAAAATAMIGDGRRLVATLLRRIDALAAVERFEDAALHRDRLSTFVRAAARMQRLAGLTSCPELVAARPRSDLGWELAVIRYGRLAGAAAVPRGEDPRPVAAALRQTAEVVEAGHGPIPAATAEETECILRWLEQPGTRLVHLEGTWASPVHGAGGQRGWVDVVEESRQAASPFEDRRPLRPITQPPGLAARDLRSGT